MPTIYAEPTIDELRTAFGEGVRATKDRYVDAREGAIYDYWSGVGAILWSREAQRTTDLWRAIYLDSAEGNELTTLLQSRYGFARIPDAYGLGTVGLTRATTAAGAGTVWAGTRFAVIGSGSVPSEPKFYVCTTDTAVGGGATTTTIPVRAALPGPGTAINVTTGARVDDPLWDSTWTVASVVCVDGTTFEAAKDARARYRSTTIAARPGYEANIIAACEAAGAGVVYLFPSDYPGEANDFGLNQAYVGYSNFTTDDALIRTVKVALEGSRVLGDNLSVRGVQTSETIIDANVYLWDGTLRYSTTSLQTRLLGAIAGYFDRVQKFGYQRDALVGAMLKAAPEVQFVTFNSPSSDTDVLSTIGGLLNFPATLNLYSFNPAHAVLTYLPPL